MIKPRFLSSGDVIGVTAPSSGASDPIDRIRFSNAEKILSSKGYSTRFTPNAFTDDGEGRSSPAEQRAGELESLISDRDVRYIVSAGGGEYLNEIYDYLDMSQISSDPKWIQGYSDNTDILLTATVNYDVMSIYCGNFGDYGMEPWHQSISDNLEFLEGKRKSQTSFMTHVDGFTERITGLEPFDCTEPTVWDSEDAEFSGRLIGGCSDKLRLIVGTGRDRMRDFAERYREDGIVWYMETYESDSEGIKEDLLSMADAGWFENTNGFLFGRPLFYETDDYREAVMSVLGSMNVPVVFDADFGHKAPRMTMINGALAEISVCEHRGTITYPEFFSEQ